MASKQALAVLFITMFIMSTSVNAWNWPWEKTPAEKEEIKKCMETTCMPECMSKRGATQEACTTACDPVCNRGFAKMRQTAAQPAH
ncbi:hypothetical protein ACHQM5_028628 [Ranunculus cassubicifolius]